MEGLRFLIPLFALAIPIVAILSRAFHRWLKFKERELQAQTHETAEKAAQYAAHTERLEQRVRVLERIVTDKGILVSDEIEGLRERTATN